MDNTHSVALNPRQERFVELYVSGVPAGRAYEQSGYTARGSAADADASKLVRNPKVSTAILRERDALRRSATLSREEKLSILAEMAVNAVLPARERIAAIKIHNEMTGDNAPRPLEVSNTASRLESIKARAMEVSTALTRRYVLTE